ncbi:hypothetical protein BDB01DRAFT_794666 [Pilobolus umbonatus]|nr:hypothetical protein BDB01DRAFT_794666 [Pilobolus umbonatus]
MITYLHSKLSILSIVVIAYLYYYLQQQRYSLRKTNVLPSLNNTFYYTTTSHNVRNLDPNEKYITFFTHSGFQNQLIQIENGLLLAWYLNRTLLLPHALLGQSFGWSTYPKLYLQHTIRDTNNNICNHKRTRSLFQKNNKLKCPDKQRYTMASFDELFDLSWARQHIRIESREYSDIHWLEHQYHIKRNKSIPEQNNGSYVDGDILFFKDYTRYDWRLFDIPRKNRFLGKYKDSMDMTELRQREEKLIHFTSLFGTGKFSLKSTEDRQFFKTLRQSITCKHPAVLKITEKVIQSLGGPGNFIGVHLR